MTAFATIKIDTKPIFAAINDLPPRALRYAGEALYLVAEEGMTLSKLRAPVRTGNLRASGYVDQPITHLIDVEVIAGFSAWYSLWVEVLHPTAAGFMSGSFTEVTAQAGPKVAKYIGDRLA